MCSAINLPGVSRSRAPPVAGMEYKCGQPSWYDRKTMRLLAAQLRLVPPWVEGTEPANVLGASHSRVAWPVEMSARQIDQGWWREVKIESGAPPEPCVRTKT